MQEDEILGCGKPTVSRRARARERVAAPRECRAQGREQVAALAELRAQSQVQSGGMIF